MGVLKLAVTLLLSVFLEAQQSFAHCPFDNDKVIRESRLIPGEALNPGEDTRTVNLLVACQDEYALLQPMTGGLRVQEINVFSTCIDPTNTSANIPEVEPSTILNVYGPTSNMSRTINVSAELGMECHYFGCYEKSITGDETQLYYTFATATCNWAPSSSRIKSSGTTDVYPSTFHPSDSSYTLLLPFRSSSTLPHNGLHTSISADFDMSLPPSPSSVPIMLRPTPIHTLLVTISAMQGLYTSIATHLHVSIPPSPSSASIMLRPTPIHTLPVPFSATQGKVITSSASVPTAMEAFTESLSLTPSIPYSTANSSLVTFWAFPLSVLGVLIIISATLVATCYIFKVRHNRYISDLYTDRALPDLKVDKLDPYFNPIGLDVISMHSDGTDYSYGNSTHNELKLVLQAAYLGSHTAEFSTTDRSSKSPENESDSYAQFSSTSASYRSNSMTCADLVQSHGDNTPVAFSQEREVDTHDIQIKSTVQLSTAKAATPLQLHNTTSTSDHQSCGLQQDSSSAEYLTEDKQEFSVAPFYLAELESGATEQFHESNDLDAQNISNQSEYVPNDIFIKDVSI